MFAWMFAWMFALDVAFAYGVFSCWKIFSYGRPEELGRVGSEPLREPGRHLTQSLHSSHSTSHPIGESLKNDFFADFTRGALSRSRSVVD